MLWPLLAVGLGATQPGDVSTTIRLVTIGVIDKQPAPITDLKAEEVVVDSSAAVASEYRSELVASVLAFWRGLPAGSRVAVWTSGPPSRVVDFDAEPAAAEPRLQSVAPAGKNYAIDAAAGRRSCRRHADAGADRARRGPVSARRADSGGRDLVGRAGLPGDDGARLRGLHGRNLTSQAAQKRLREAAVDLSSEYRVRYESTAAVAPKVEVRRKGVKLRVGLGAVEVLKAN